MPWLTSAFFWATSLPRSARSSLRRAISRATSSLRAVMVASSCFSWSSLAASAVGLVLQFGDNGAEQHGAAQRRQNVVGLHHQGGRRVLFQPLQPGEELGEHVLLLAQVGQELGAVRGQLGEFRLALRQ